jgi:hypothetical protein
MWDCRAATHALSGSDPIETLLPALVAEDEDVAETGVIGSTMNFVLLIPGA